MPLPPAAAGLAALAAAALAAPRPAEALATLLAPTGGPPTAVLVAALGLLAQATAAWLLLVALLTLGARAPSVAGRACRAVLHRCAPAGVRRAAALALGAGLALGLAPPASAATPSPVAATAGPALPPLDWPGLVPPEPAPDAAASRQAPPGHATTQPPPPRRPAAEPAAPRATTPRATPPRASVPRTAVPRTTTVVVRPGDTLWDLAGRSLAAPVSDADRAAEWPRWWAANRDVVGDDPDLLLPGQRLDAPPAR